MIDDIEITLGGLIDRTVLDAPDRTVLSWNGVDTSYREFAQLTCRAASAWETLGVSAGDRVVLIMDNRPEMLVAFVGLARLGACMVALNPQLSASELAYLIGDCRARMVLTTADRQEVATEAAELADVHAPILTTEPSGDRPCWADLIDNSDVTSVDRATPATPLSIIYTSGSTGRSKGVVHTHQSLIYFGQGYGSWLGLTTSDRVYVCLPLYHVNSQGYAFLGALAAQACVVLAPKYSRSGFWADIDAGKVTATNLISLMLAVLTDLDDAMLHQAATLRIVYGSAVGRLSPDQRLALEERLGLTMRTGYGMSETGFGFIEPLVLPKILPGSVGKLRHHPNPLVPRSEAQILDSDGELVPTGETGELALRNPAMMAGYLVDGRPDRSGIRAGWFRTGDNFRCDDDGNFYFVGRGLDVIRRRGEKISAPEVEGVLRQVEGIGEAAVIGVPVEGSDEELYAFLVRREGAHCTAGDVWASLEWRIAAFKIPRFLDFVADLPLTASQKVAKKELVASVEISRAFDKERG